MDMKHTVTDVNRYNNYATDIKQFYDGAEIGRAHV